MKIILKEGQEVLDKKGNKYLTELNDSVIGIKEAGQYTFDGDIVDSFYDENKVYKAIYKKFEPIFLPMEKNDFLSKGKTAKKLAEDIFDYLGDVPADANLEDVLEDLLMDDDFRDAIWIPEVLDKTVEAYNNSGSWFEDYNKSEECWNDNSYIAFEGGDFEFMDNVSLNVVKDLESVGATLEDLSEWLERDRKSLPIKVGFESHYHGLDTNKYLVLWSSAIGEVEDQVNEDLAEVFQSLDKDDAQYVSSNIDYTISEEGEYLYVDLSSELVGYYIDWKDIRKDFLRDFA